MNIFITGAEGFIGSHLTEKLIAKGHKVKCLVQYNFQNSHGWLDSIDKKIKNETEVITGDIRDENLIQKHVGKNTEVIFNLAALIGIPYSYSAPRSYVDTNVIGALNILNASKNLNNLKYIVQTSTSEVYGTAQKIPIKEDHPLNAQSPYAASKIAADQIALSFYRSYKLPVVIIRPFNTFGPRQSARAIIPTIILQILNNRGIIKLGNLLPKRDFTYVEDTADCFLKVLSAKNIQGEIINVGNNFEISIKNIIKIIKEDFGYNFKVSLDPRRVRVKKSEVFRLLACNKKAKKLLKWSPNFSDLKGFKVGLKKTIDWFKNSKNIEKYKLEDYSV